MDEVGRGPLAGPVTVGVVLMREKEAKRLPPLRDSKRLTQAGRARVVRKYILEKGAKYALASVSAKVIDRRGISAAVRTAVRLALQRVGARPGVCKVVLDGNLSAPIKYYQKTIVRGDETVPIIALASSVAKLHRDRLMKRYAKRYPGYGFERHVGYGTTAHYAAIRTLGPSEIHRRSFLS